MQERWGNCRRRDDSPRDDGRAEQQPKRRSIFEPVVPLVRLTEELARAQKRRAVYTTVLNRARELAPELFLLLPHVGGPPLCVVEPVLEDSLRHEYRRPAQRQSKKQFLVLRYDQPLVPPTYRTEELRANEALSWNGDPRREPSEHEFGNQARANLEIVDEVPDGPGRGQ